MGSPVACLAPRKANEGKRKEEERIQQMEQEIRRPALLMLLQCHRWDISMKRGLWLGTSMEDSPASHVKKTRGHLKLEDS